MKIPASSNLEEAGRRFWNQVSVDFELSESHDLERLKMACRCLDDIEVAEDILRKEGHFLRDRFEQVKEHPGCKAIRDNKVLFCRIIRELGLDIVTPVDNRPPKLY